MICKTRAIPLSIHPVTNTSEMVHWLTPDCGRITTLIKGAQRKKSLFIGQYRQFETSELLYYPRSGEVQLAKECSLLSSRSDTLRDWRKTLCASYLSALIRRAAPEHDEAANLFHLYEETLDQLGGSANPLFFTLWFELRFCGMLGHAPLLEECIVCRQSAPGLKGGLRISASHGGVICAACAVRNRVPVLPLTPDVLAIMQRLKNSASPALAEKMKYTPAQLDSLREIGAVFTAHHLEIRPEIRAALFDAFLLHRRLSA